MLRELETLQPPVRQGGIGAQGQEGNGTIQMYWMPILHFVN